MAKRPAALLAAILCLSGCSHAYEVRASRIGDQIIFTSDKSWFRQRCVREIEIIAEDRGNRAAAQPGDDKVRVGYGTYWRSEVGYHCENRFPVRYGDALQGPPLAGDRASGVVSPKPLRVGVIYNVGTVTGATGYGSGKFVIRADGSIQNLDSP